MGIIETYTKIEDGDQLLITVAKHKPRKTEVNVLSLALLVKRKHINKRLQITYNVLFMIPLINTTIDL